MRTTISLLLTIVFCGCLQPNVNLEEEKSAIIRCWKDWEEKEKSGDPELMNYYWADDAMIMGQGMPTIKGKEEIRKFLDNLPKEPGFKMTWEKEPSAIDISGDGRRAYLLAKNEVSFKDSAGVMQTRINQAVQVWKKDNSGNWKAALSVIYPETATP